MKRKRLLALLLTGVLVLQNGGLQVYAIEDKTLWDASSLTLVEADTESEEAVPDSDPYADGSKLGTGSGELLEDSDPETWNLDLSDGISLNSSGGETEAETEAWTSSREDVFSIDAMEFSPADSAVNAGEEFVEYVEAETEEAAAFSEDETETEETLQAAEDTSAGDPADPDGAEVLSWEEFYALECEMIAMDDLTEEEFKQIYVKLKKAYICYRAQMRLAEVQAGAGTGQEEAVSQEGTGMEAAGAEDESSLIMETDAVEEDETLAADDIEEMTAASFDSGLAEEGETLPGGLIEEASEMTAAESSSLMALTEEEENILTAQASGSSGGRFENEYLEVAIDGNGQFSIGTNQGDPDFDSDDNKKLLYGHPDPGTSETLIKVGDTERIFIADTVDCFSDSAVAVMNIPEESIRVTQYLTLTESGNTSYKDQIKIAYTVENYGSSVKPVGVRIMLDTMIGANDDAPFSVAGVGRVTDTRTFNGANVPVFYQAYDNLDNPTVLSSGYLITKNDRKPDKVQFAHWGSIHGSAWNYSVEDHEDLGDSAVGIYFNEKSVPAGSDISVCTYYGVGIGISSTNTQAVLDQDHVKLEVINAVSKTALKGVTLKLEDGTEVQTDNDGAAIVALAKADDKDITASLQDYDSVTYRKKMTGGRSYIIRMKKTGDTTPVILSAIFDSTDILSDSVKYLEDISSLLEKPSNASKVKKCKLQVVSDTAGCIYYLYKDNTEVMHNENGIFEFDTMEAGDGSGRTYISKLSAGANYYVRVVSPDGKSVKEQILIRIYTPSGALDSDWLETLRNGKMNIIPSSGVDVSNNWLLKLVAGGENKFKIGADWKFPIDVKVTPEPLELELGINTDAHFLDNTKAKNFYSDRVYKLSKNSSAKEKKELQNKMKGWAKAKKPNFRLGTLSAGFDFMGYGKFKPKKNEDGSWQGFRNASGELQMPFEGTVYLTLSFGYDYSHTRNFPSLFSIPVPVYITIGSSGKVEMQFGGPMQFQDVHSLQDFLLEALDEFNASIGLSFEGGAGRDGGKFAVKAGVKISGTLDYKYNFKSTYTKLSTTVAGSLEAQALLWSWSYPVASKTWIIKEGYDDGSSSLSAAEAAPDLEELLNDGNAQLIPRDYADLQAADSGDDSLVMSNVYTSAAPSQITAGGHVYRFWLQDISTREAQNRTALVYTMDGGEMTIVEDDGTADSSYVLASCGTDLYAAWMDCNAVFGADVTVSDTEQSLEITLARIDTSAGNETKIFQVTENSVLDQIPALWAAENAVYVAWNSKTSGFFDAVTGSRLNYRVLNGDTLSAGTAVTLPDRFMQNLDIVSAGGALSAVYTLADIGEAFEQVNKQTYYYPLSGGETQKTSVSDPEGTPAAVKLAGADSLLWFDEGNYYYMPADAPTDAAKSVFAEGAEPGTATDTFVVIEDGSKTWLIWVDGVMASDEEESAFDHTASACVYEEGAWSSAFKVAELGTGIVNGFSGTLDENGNVVLFWQSIEYAEDGTLSDSALHELTIGEYTDLVLGDLTFDDAGAPAGEDFELTLVLENAGNTEIDRAVITVDDTDTELTSLALAPGASVSRTVSVTVPESGPWTYNVYAYAEGDVDETNNEDSFDLGHSILTITQLAPVMEISGEKVPLEIANGANFDTEEIVLRIFADRELSTVLYRCEVGTVKAGQSVFVSVPSSIFDLAPVAYAILVVPGEESMEEKVPCELSFDDMSVRFMNSYSFSVTAGEGGTLGGAYESAYTEETEIPLSAEPSEGYAFWQWTSDNGGTFSDQTAAQTDFVMPAGNVNLTAEFRRFNPAQSIAVTLPGGDDPETAAPEITAGETITLVTSVTAEDPEADASDHIFYASSDETVAKIGPDGTITAVGGGTAQITVTCGDQEKTFTVEVKDVLIEEISLEQRAFLNGIGDESSINYELIPPNASQKPVWKSSDPSVVVVDQEGKIRAAGCGSAVITAKSPSNESVLSVCEVKVTAELESIQLSDMSLVLQKGVEGEDTKTLTARFLPEGVELPEDASWTVNGSSVEISPVEGAPYGNAVTLTALMRGTSVVQVSAQSSANDMPVTANCVVTVEVPATGFTVSQEVLTIREGSSDSADFSLEPSDSTSSVTYSSSNMEVATVDEDGNVFGRGVGTATITARADNGVTAFRQVSVISLELARTPLAEGTGQIIDITEVGGYHTLVLVPRMSGSYVISSSGDYDTKATLYDASGNYLESDDDSGTDRNFSITYNMTAGRTYLLRAQMYSSGTGSFSVAYGMLAPARGTKEYCQLYGHSWSRWTTVGGMMMRTCICGKVQMQPLPERITITKAPSKFKAKAGKKGKVTLSWKKIKANKKGKALLKTIRNIEIQYSTDPGFPVKNRITKYAGKKKTKLSLKLRKKTVYYVRIRYCGVDGGFSNWTMKTVKTKK